MTEQKTQELIITLVRYTLFMAHPVLGSIMAIYALDDLEPGEEVLCNYGYKDNRFYEILNIRND